MDYLLKGICIGLLFGLPVGAVGALAVQRTFSHGVKAGLLTGLGSSVADCMYACIGVLGLTFVSDFLLQRRMIITVLGGGLVLYLGIRSLLRKEETVVQEAVDTDFTRMFLSSFAVGVTNPAAILTFLFAFSYFGISADAGAFSGALLVGGVFLGTYIWWGTLSAVTCVIKKKTGNRSFRTMNKVFGSILALIGVVVILRLFL